jgi:hypothetical protein
MERPSEALIGLGLMATGLPFYFYWKKVNLKIWNLKIWEWN